MVTIEDVCDDLRGSNRYYYKVANSIIRFLYRTQPDGLSVFPDCYALWQPDTDWPIYRITAGDFTSHGLLPIDINFRDDPDAWDVVFLARYLQACWDHK